MTIDIKKVTQAVAVFTMIAGGFGMIHSLPYLYSANIADLIGAGFPFVAGSILFASGLLTFRYNTDEPTPEQPA